MMHDSAKFVPKGLTDNCLLCGFQLPETDKKIKENNNLMKHGSTVVLKTKQ
jgi:hypothetical protein